MANVNATTGHEPDYIEDEDLLSLDEMRGAMKDIIKGKKTLNQQATVAGCLQEMDILKQKLDNCYEKLSRMTALYQTLSNEFTQFKQQRALELNMKVNGGSTTPEDMG